MAGRCILVATLLGIGASPSSSSRISTAPPICRTGRRHPHTSTSRGYYDPGGPNAPRGGGGVGKNNTITLSRLFNFPDGQRSCCGSARIFVFATNHIEKLDPALLRSGRMDMRMHMSYCSYPTLRILLRNYLGSEAEDLGGTVAAAARELREAVEKAKMTLADISEVPIKNRMNKERAVGGVAGGVEGESGEEREGEDDGAKKKAK
ncbi:hypothetical protein NL676_034650 [Syzygium grande]|nr:hypothetical protein NL676_034650 [Syzygium grande]